MNELYFEHHLEGLRRLFGYEGPGSKVSEANLKYAEEQARHAHALAVWDPLLRLAGRVSLEAPQKLTNHEAQIYLRYGVGRRVGDMFEVYRAIVLTAHEGRKDPLRHDEQQEFSRNLNTFYINLRGTMDNLAFCLLHERQPELLDELRDVDIGLFSPKYRSSLRDFAEIKAKIAKHDEWNREIKSRRDPAAHRIPLYLPPSQVTDEEAGRIQQLLAMEREQAIAGNGDAADRLFGRAMSIGRFFPAFLHHPDHGPIPIYPTIPNDAGHMIEIASAVIDYLVS